MSGGSGRWQVAPVVALALFWAVNWPLMKIGLMTVEPWTFRFLTVLAGGIGSLALAYLFGERLLPTRGELGWLLLLSFVQATLWNGFSGFGIAFSEAGRAALVAFTMPIWATILSVLLLGERVIGRRLVGLGVGLLGVAALLAPALASLGANLPGTLCMLAAAMAWGAGTVIFKAARWESSILVVTGWHFLIGGAPLLLAALALGEPATLLDVDPATAAALAYSALIPMILCQYIWFRIVREVPANLAAMSTLAVPGLGLVASALVLDERIGPFEVLGLVLVTSALVLILTSLSWRASPRPRPAPHLE